MTLKLRTQIILKIVIPTTFLLLLICAVTIGVLWPNITLWSQDIRNHTINEEIKNLKLRTSNIEHMVSLFFNQVIGDVEHLAEYSNKIHKGELNITSYYPSYSVTSRINSTLPSDKLEMDYLGYSGWFNKFNMNSTYLDESSINDNIWRALWKSNDDYVGLYTGYNDATFRHYPYMILDSYPTLSYTCLINNYPTIGYDPRCREWYIGAKKNTTTVYITSPYIDASSGKVLISASKAFSDITNELIGVSSVDISMEKIESIILSEKILNNGYTYLVDKMGKLLVYPEMDRDDVYYLGEKEFENDVEKTKFQNEIFSQMLIKETGQEEFIKNNNKWLITYSKINNTNYIIALVVPYSDITNATDYIENQTVDSIINTMIAMIVILIIVCVINFITNWSLANNITKPINELNDGFNKISDDDLNIELGNKNPEIKEVYKIYTKFDKLVHTIKFANHNVYSNNIDLAIKDYNIVEEMLEKYGNKVGLGVLWNNKGYAWKIKGDYNKSIEYFEKSIINAKNYLSNKNNDNKNMQSLFRIKLANRYMGLGLVFAEKGDFKKAEAAYQESILLNDKADNPLGKVKTLGNYGLLYLDADDNKEAFEKFLEAYNMATSKFNENNTDKNGEVLQYASYNMAEYYFRTKDYIQANRFVQYGLSIKPTIDINFQMTCLKLMADIAEKCGDITRATRIRKEFNNIEPKHIVFVLDVSGSMHGKRINVCKDSIKNILNEHMNDNDYVSYLKFSDKINWAFQKQNISENKNSIITTINKTKAGGGTSFYDALASAIKYVDDRKNNDMHNISQWIIALTDGEDQNSNNTLKAVRKYIEKKNINIIIIGALLSNSKIKSDLRSLTLTSNDNMYIDAENIEAINSAFIKAAEYINRGQFVLEDL